MSDYSGLITELQRSCNGLNNKVKALEEEVERLDRILRIRTPIEKRCVALEKNVKGIIERLDTHNNEGHERFKEIKALESTLLKIFNAFSQKYADGWSEDTLYVKLIEIEYDLKKQLDGKQ